MSVSTISSDVGSANTVFIRLDGPLQSWGIRARWVERDTMLEPTKSGVLGLIACALGYSRDDPRVRDLSSNLLYGVRVDKSGQVLRDYHTVVGGVRSAEGKIKKTQATGEIETVVSERFYLADASFLAALQGQEASISLIAYALQNPYWPPYLGRRSCPPSVPLFEGTGRYDSLEDALRAQPLPEHLLADNRRRGRANEGSSVTLRISVECRPDEGNVRPDNIESLRLRRYGPRYARDDIVSVPISSADHQEENEEE